MGKFLTREDIIKQVQAALEPPKPILSQAKPGLPKVSTENRNAIMQRLMGMAGKSSQTPPSLGLGMAQGIPKQPPKIANIIPQRKK